MTDDVHLVVALCGAFIAILGLIFTVAFYMERCAQLRAELASTRDDLALADTLLARMGARRPRVVAPELVPNPERGQL